MPRIVSNAIRAKLNQRLASVPILRLRLFWREPFATSISTNPISIFTSKDKMVNVGAISVSRRDDHTGTIGTCSITLDDSDGYIKDLTNHFQLEGTNSQLDQMFDDVPNDWAVLLLGKITDINWSEGSRTVSFTIESETFSEELGFQPSLDDDPDLNPDAVDVAWPLVFGMPTHVPTVHARHRPEGFLQSFVWLNSDVYTAQVTSPTAKTNAQLINEVIAGTANTKVTVEKVELVDWCTEFSYTFNEESNVQTQVENKIYVRGGELFPQDETIQIEIDGVIFEGSFSENVFTVTRANCEKYVNLICDSRVSDSDYNNPSVCWIRSTTAKIVNCHCYLFNPAGRPIFNRCIRQEGQKCWFSRPFISSTGKKFTVTELNRFLSVYSIERFGLKDFTDLSGAKTSLTEEFEAMYAQGHGKGLFMSYAYMLRQIQNHIDKAKFWSAYEETKVHLWNSDEKEVYICNLIPSTKIQAVYGFRRDENNRRIFIPVPSIYYTKFLNYSIDGFNTTALTFDTLLSNIEGQGWEDEIYVTLESSIGPNISDVIRWILLTYTECTIDATSFANVKARLQGFPVNFAILGKEDALRVAQSIAWESRCALSVINNVAILYYVAGFPTPVFTLNSGNIEEKSLSIQYSQMNDITTRYELEWKDSYRPRPERAFLDSKRRHKLDNIHKFVLSKNTFLYGVQPETRKFLTYNSREYVYQSAAFWLNRKSNSWTKIKLNTFLQGILLLPFDAVWLNISEQDFFIAYDCLCVVESASYNPVDKTTTLELIVPIRQSYSIPDSNFWINKESVPAITNPSLSYKEVKYDKQI